MKPSDYFLLREHLDCPRGRIVTEADFIESLHPHASPLEGEWPAPTSEETCRKLLDRLPPRQCTVCALTAAEMVLTDWFHYARESGLSASQMQAPQVAIRNAWRWLEGRFRLTDLADSVDNVAIATDNARARVAPARQWWMYYWDGERWTRDDTQPMPLYAALSARFAAMTATFAAGPSEKDRKARVWKHNSKTSAHVALHAVDCAAQAAGAFVSDDSLCRFLDAWWARCAGRLAFADVTECEIF